MLRNHVGWSVRGRSGSCQLPGLLVMAAQGRPRVAQAAEDV
jgi:hypothetical protein